MALQTNYGDTQPAAVAGAPATMIAAIDLSRNVEDAAGIAFGKPVQQGVTDKGIAAFAGGKFVGITMLDRSATGTPTSPDGFPQRASAKVRVSGDVWVTAAAVVAAGDSVYLTEDGALTNAEDENTLLSGARWDTSTTAPGQLAVLRLR